MTSTVRDRSFALHSIAQCTQLCRIPLDETRTGHEH